MFKWKETFSCNIEAIDEQHKTLFQLGTKLFSIYSLKDGFDHYDEILAVLKELKEYTIYHFKYEEDLMRRLEFSGLEDHIKEHNAFINEILRLESEDIDEKQKKITMEILVFVSNWIEKHILKTDMGYSHFFISRGIN